jgi:hypothetical protein
MSKSFLVKQLHPMNERWSPPSLDVRFPPLQAASYYQLLHVGRVRHLPASPLDQEALVYFQVGPGPDGEPIGSGLVAQQVNMQRVALLIPGSRWSASGQLLSDGSHAYPAYRTVALGAHVPHLCRLSQVLPAGTVLPPVLHAALRDAWYAVVDAGAERLLIPCFELLRAFYYQAGGKLVDYFFSRLPLEAVCWPIMAPTPATDFTAQFCVAAQLGRPHEARVLAKLLYNASYRAIIQRTHAELAVAWHERATRGLVAEAYPKAFFNLGKTVSVTAHGTTFTVGEQAFFGSVVLSRPPTGLASAP